jgi:hypothetical protein
MKKVFLLFAIISIIILSSCGSSKYGCGSHGRKGGYSGRFITGFRQDF